MLEREIQAMLQHQKLSPISSLARLTLSPIKNVEANHQAAYDQKTLLAGRNSVNHMKDRMMALNGSLRAVGYLSTIQQQSQKLLTYASFTKYCTPQRNGVRAVGVQPTKNLIGIKSAEKISRRKEKKFIRVSLPALTKCSTESKLFPI